MYYSSVEFCLDVGGICLVFYSSGEFVYHIEEMDLHFLFYLFDLTYISRQCMFSD